MDRLVNSITLEVNVLRLLRKRVLKLSLSTPTLPPYRHRVRRVSQLPRQIRFTSSPFVHMWSWILFTRRNLMVSSFQWVVRLLSTLVSNCGIRVNSKRLEWKFWVLKYLLLRPPKIVKSSLKSWQRLEKVLPCPTVQPTSMRRWRLPIRLDIPSWSVLHSHLEV